MNNYTKILGFVIGIAVLFKTINSVADEIHKFSGGWVEKSIMKFSIVMFMVMIGYSTLNDDTSSPVDKVSTKKVATSSINGSSHASLLSRGIAPRC